MAMKEFEMKEEREKKETFVLSEDKKEIESEQSQKLTMMMVWILNKY